MSIEAVILAAGRGTRMKSTMPKVLHPLAGKSMLGRVLDAARDSGASRLHTIIGHGAEQVKERFALSQDIQWVLQSEQLGTGHAVLQALPGLDSDSVALILYGDVPLLSATTLKSLVDLVKPKTMGLLTVTLADPSGYGRILRDAAGKVTGIVEQKDASPEQLAVNEVNTGILAVAVADLQRWLPSLSNDNAQGEYYLTDIIALAAGEGFTVATLQPGSAAEVEGVNSRAQLASLEREYQLAQAELLMASGVTLADPARIDIRGQLSSGCDTSIDVNFIAQGEVTLGENVVIGPNCMIINSTLGDGVVVEANSVIEDAQIGDHATIGPFARLRPGTRLCEGSKVGNFVETKKSIIGKGSKVNHLSYIGDAEVGEGANIGAGTITCNYDGVNKHKTTIDDGAFIGSNTSLVAPVNVGKGATIGAGSTVTGDVKDHQLAVARGRQKNIDNWARPEKNKK